MKRPGSATYSTWFAVRPLAVMKVVLAFIAIAFCAAPVPGDVGGCGQEPQELDPEVFFWSLQGTECDGCNECGLMTRACDRACGELLVQSEFPKDCAPLVHDGEVCLRALQDASCGDLGEYMSDSAPSIPTECDFCPPGGQR
jgi:hypothetical protein